MLRTVARSMALPGLGRGASLARVRLARAVQACVGVFLAMGWAAVPLTSLPAAETTANLVEDGALEHWQATGPQDGWWNYLAVEWRQAEFARDEQGRFLTPMILSQLYDTKTLKPETADVHGGGKALRLKGQFYLRPSQQKAYETQDGDVYLVRYWVKGEGETLMYLHVYGDAAAQIVETSGTPQKERWSMIEERIQVAGRAPTTVYPRLWAGSEMLIDDISVVRLIRTDEHRLEEVAADLQKRVAFAWPSGGAVVLDGNLTEPAWAQAVALGGFRAHGDQTLLAAVQPSFRVLYDEQGLYLGLEIPLADAPQVQEDLLRQPLQDAAGQPIPKGDTFSGRHSIELFLQAPGQSSYRQLVVSLDGYRYDSTGMDASWNGAWESALRVAADRWFLEIRVPVRDLGVEQTRPAVGWRLNLCCNQPGVGSTWAAVGNNFHNPDAFGELLVQDFDTWRQAQPRQLEQKRAALIAAAGPGAGLYAARLAALDAAGAAGPAAGSARDWQSITRTYARLDYIGRAQRCMEEEERYREYFR
jgi:hypothetical protein